MVVNVNECHLAGKRNIKSNTGMYSKLCIENNKTTEIFMSVNLLLPFKI